MQVVILVLHLNKAHEFHGSNAPPPDRSLPEYCEPASGHVNSSPFVIYTVYQTSISNFRNV